MARNPRLLGRLLALFALLAALALPGAAAAQEPYTFTAGILGGAGGSADSGFRDFSNTGFQLDLAMITETSTQVGFRFGRLNLDHGGSFGTLTGANLEYVTVGGEYRFQESYYESGLFLALGGYRLSGTPPAGGSVSHTSVGLSLGVTGEFRIQRHLGVIVEFSGHYADLKEAKLFAMGHAGLAVHF
ncbi:MAG TPA: hypothetical protein VOA87_22085 [Thermoanaerobaculia bacterium]|nr:hypothetical protein [Thermoanaerobaculia bacterium]